MGDPFSIESSISFEDNSAWDELLIEAARCGKEIFTKSGTGSDFLGWVDLPEKMLAAGQLKKIKDAASEIQDTSEILVSVGIGGSYLGAKAVIEALGSFYKNISILSGKESGTVVLFAGQHIFGQELDELDKFLTDRSFSINIISKSGTTTEPSLAFRVLLQTLKKKYGSGYQKRVFATTDSHKGALRKLADNQGFSSFVIPNDVGGRYSVFSPVGLLPIQAAGINIEELLSGALKMQKIVREKEGMENPALLYAGLRNHFYRKGLSTEVLATYIPKTQMISEWWKQLFGESEGKGGKGLWPSSVVFTTDLHSLGQWLQDGPRNFFETMLAWKERSDISIPHDPQNTDGLGFLEKKSFSDINEIARQATTKAHIDGGVHIVTIYPGELSAMNLGALIYFFEFSCAVSGYMLGVNPFDQPGVEAYKKNMFRLLGKPGF